MSTDILNEVELFLNDNKINEVYNQYKQQNKAINKANHSNKNNNKTVVKSGKSKQHDTKQNNNNNDLKQNNDSNKRSDKSDNKHKQNNVNLSGNTQHDKHHKQQNKTNNNNQNNQKQHNNKPIEQQHNTDNKQNTQSSKIGNKQHNMLANDNKNGNSNTQTNSKHNDDDSNDQDNLDTYDIQLWYNHKSIKQSYKLIQSIKKQNIQPLNKVDYDNNIQQSITYGNDMLHKLQQATNSHNNNDKQFYNNIASHGTLNDRIAALTLQIQESPIHRLYELDSLIHMLQKKERRIQNIVVDALNELFINTLLPNNRALLSIQQQIILKYYKYNDSNIPSELIFYYIFEHELKKRFTQYLAIIEAHTHDLLVYTKLNRLNILYNLLTNVPEQEATVLSLLCNKLGDPVRQVSSKVVYLLTKLLQQHPAMKYPVVKELEYVLFRPNITIKSQYYVLIYMNSILFNADNDSELAYKCINIYFTLFNTYVNKITSKTTKDNNIQVKSISTKLLSALLTGVNRALPYAKSYIQNNNALFEKHLNKLFYIVHNTPINVSIQSLMLLYQCIHYDSDNIVLTTDNNLITRYYRTLYQLLLNQDLWFSSSRYAYVLNLLYKSIKTDHNQQRICAFIRRILQQSLQYQCNYIAAVLYMISQLITIHPFIGRLFDMNESYDDDDIDHVSVKEEYDNNDNDTNNQQQQQHLSTRYDPHKREPQYSNAHNSVSYETCLLTTHYHPSIVSFSTSLLHNKPIIYDSDPLTDFNTSVFLDKFIYKKPKSIESMKSKYVAINRPHERISKSTKINNELPINSNEWLNKYSNIASVPVDNMFFYKYFSDKKQIDNQNIELQQQLAKQAEYDNIDIETYADQVMENEILRDAYVSDDDISDTELNDAYGSVEDDDDDDEQFTMGRDNDNDDDIDDDDNNVQDDNDDSNDDDELDDVITGQVEGSTSEDDDHDNDNVNDSDDNDEYDAMLDNSDLSDPDSDIDIRDTKQVKRKTNASLFASADDYADILANAGDVDNAKLDKWQNNKNRLNSNNKNKRRKR